jgi:hypothetical protein
MGYFVKPNKKTAHRSARSPSASTLTAGYMRRSPYHVGLDFITLVNENLIRQNLLWGKREGRLGSLYWTRCKLSRLCFAVV